MSQTLQTDAPVAEVQYPVEHGIQTELLRAPTTVENVPRGHCTHVEEEFAPVTFE